MASRLSSHPRSNGFSLVEMLVVMAIISILVAVSTISIESLNGAGKFTTSVSTVSGILEQARSYAVAQNTYVWVALYENSPAGNAPGDVYIAAFASNDGSDPFGWSGSVSLPSPGTVGTTTIVPIMKVNRLSGLHLETTTLPTAPDSANLPAQTPDFEVVGHSNAGTVTLSSGSTGYALIEFAPNGAAHNGPNPIDSIWLGLQLAHTATSYDAHNVAGIEVNGLTGLCSVHRS